MVGVIGGVLLAEEQEIDFSRTANAQQVDTVIKGFAGLSPGSPMLEVDVNNAAPQGGSRTERSPARRPARTRANSPAASSPWASVSIQRTVVGSLRSSPYSPKRGS